MDGDRRADEASGSARLRLTDAGALVAWERATRTMVALVAEARAIGATLTVPAGCVAQAWRNPRRQARLAALLRRPEIDIVPLDASDARLVGVLLASTQTTDTVRPHCHLRPALGPAGAHQRPGRPVTPIGGDPDCPRVATESFGEPPGFTLPLSRLAAV